MAKRSTQAVTSDVGPFAIVPLWIAEAVVDEPNGARAIQVFTLLHRWTNADRNCFPSLQSIANAAGVTIPTARRAIQTLQDIGAVEVTGRTVEGSKERTSNLYHLIYVRPIIGAGTNVGDTTSEHEVSDPSYHGLGRNQIHLEADPPNQIENVSDIVQEAEIVPDWELSFRAFWKHYPRKVNKQTALKAWRKLTEADRSAASQILPDHVEHWTHSKTAVEFIPHPTSWLNGRRWEDELVTDYKPAGSLVDAVIQYARQANRQEPDHADRRSDSSPRSIGRGDDRLD